MSEPFVIAAVVSGLLLLLVNLYRTQQFDTPKKLRGNLVKLTNAGVDYPGHMAFANKGGEYFHGCRVALFKNVRDMNKFFEPGNAGHLKLVGEIIPGPQGIMVVFNAKLSSSDMEDIDEWNRAQHEYFSKKRAHREQEKLAAEESKLLAEAEDKKFARIGRRYSARVSKIKEMAPGADRNSAEKALNAGELPEDE